MDTLHTALCSLQPETNETKSRRDHLKVFREFLDRAARKRSVPRNAKAPKAKARRGKR